MFNFRFVRVDLRLLNRRKQLVHGSSTNNRRDTLQWLNSERTAGPSRTVAVRVGWSSAVGSAIASKDWRTQRGNTLIPGPCFGGVVVPAPDPQLRPKADFTSRLRYLIVTYPPAFSMIISQPCVPLTST